MNAHDHYKWACDRAMEYANSGDMVNAWASFVSDCNKHTDTQHIAYHDLTRMHMTLPNQSIRDFEHFITGWAIKDTDGELRTINERLKQNLEELDGDA